MQLVRSPVPEETSGQCSSNPAGPAAVSDLVNSKLKFTRPSAVGVGFGAASGKEERDRLWSSISGGPSGGNPQILQEQTSNLASDLRFSVYQSSARPSGQGHKLLSCSERDSQERDLSQGEAGSPVRPQA